MGSKEKGSKQRGGGASSPRARKGEFPIRAADYELLEPIGDGATAVVRRARCLPLGGEVVAVKIMNMALRSEADVVCTSPKLAPFDRSPLHQLISITSIDPNSARDVQNNAAEEVKTMILTDHPNLLGAYCSFTEGENLWIVMPYMAGGSCFHLMKSSFPKGFEDERFIAFVLRETLRGLQYLHGKGHIHRDVKAYTYL